VHVGCMHTLHGHVLQRAVLLLAEVPIGLGHGGVL